FLLVRSQSGSDLGHQIVVDLFELFCSRTSLQYGKTVWICTAAPATTASAAVLSPPLWSNGRGKVTELLEGSLDDGPQSPFLIAAERDICFRLQERFHRFHWIDGIDSCKYLVAATSCKRSAATTGVILCKRRYCKQ